MLLDAEPVLDPDMSSFFHCFSSLDPNAVTAVLLLLFSCSSAKDFFFFFLNSLVFLRQQFVRYSRIEVAL